MRLRRQWNCWSLRCSWRIPCQRCSNYIFILDLTPDFNILHKDNCETRWKTFMLFIWCILSKRFDGTWYVSSNHTEIITIVTHFGHTGSVTSLTSIKLWPQYLSLKLCQLINHYTSKCICMQYLKLSRLHHNQWFHSSMGSAIQGDVTLNNGQYHNPCEWGTSVDSYTAPVRCLNGRQLLVL